MLNINYYVGPHKLSNTDTSKVLTLINSFKLIDDDIDLVNCHDSCSQIFSKTKVFLDR